MVVRTISTVIIGAGHAGLAMSRCLTQHGIEHVVLERGEIANSWRTERWASLRLLTPNWQTRLPSYAYAGSDPDGYMGVPEVVAFIEGYARAHSAPVETRTRVVCVRQSDASYLVQTDRGDWRSRALVLASGACNLPTMPKIASAVPPDILTVSSHAYREPASLPGGGALVIGASATGTQIADEIQRSGRPVTLSVGAHIRVPRVYRGRDILWWMDRSGLQDERYDEVDDIDRARRVPSLQLVGSDERRTLDLNALAGLGVRLVGRLVGFRGRMAQFSGSLRNQCALSDLKMNRLLATIDAWASTAGLDGGVAPKHRFPPTEVPDRPMLSLDLAAAGIRTIVWATGYHPDYSWLQLPVLDRKGRIRHDGGVTSLPGVYAMGLQFLRRRKSSLIDGAADDARELSAHLAKFLEPGVSGTA